MNLFIAICKGHESKSEKRGWVCSGQHNFKIWEPHNVSPSTVHTDWFNPTVHISPTSSHKPLNFSVPFGRLKKKAKLSQELSLEGLSSSALSPYLSLTTPFVFSLGICCFQKVHFDFSAFLIGSVCRFIRLFLVVSFYFFARHFLCSLSRFISFFYVDYLNFDS